MSEILPEGLEFSSRPPHGIFCFGGDAYQAQDVLAIQREEKDTIRIQLRGIQDATEYSYNSETLRDEAWEKGVADWREATLAARQSYAG